MKANPVYLKERDVYKRQSFFNPREAAFPMEQISLLRKE